MVCGNSYRHISALPTEGRALRISAHISPEVGWPGNRGSRAPTEPYVTVSRHTALVVLVSPHGTRFSDPCPVHEIIRRFLDACVPFAHGFGPADP